MSDKELRELYGVSESGIPATAVYVRDLHGFPENTKAERWILVNNQTRKITYVNLYNDKAGGKFDQSANTFDLPEDAKLQKKLRGFTEKPLAECPVAVAV